MLVLIALLAGLFQQIPETTGTIEGMVLRKGTSFPVAGVQIKATVGTSIAIEAITDGAGRFILRDVPAGRVAIEARMEGYVFPSEILRFETTLAGGQNLKLPGIPATRGATIRGRVVDEKGDGIPDVPMVFFQSVVTDALGSTQLISMMGVVRSDDQGEYRREMLPPGDYYVRATIEKPDMPQLAVFYPSTIDSATAALVVLGEGAETTADIRITDTLRANTFKISGRILRLPNMAEPSSIGLLLRTQVPRPATVADTAGNEKTGAFELQGIRSGSYDLFATADIEGKEYMAKIPVEVRGRDVADLEVALRPLLEIKGRLLADVDSKDLQLMRRGAGAVKITLNRKDQLFGESLLQPVIDDSGTGFVFTEVPQGDYNLAVTFMPDRGRPPSTDLYVADIRAGSVSVFDRGLQVGTDLIDAVEIVVGSNGGSIAGTISNMNPRQGAIIILAPEFSRRDNPSLFRTGSPSNAEGQFQMRGLTPGTYKIFAVPAGSPLSYRNPEYLAQYEPRALTVVVQKGNPVVGLRVPLLTPGR
jgi:hypothetical protein